MSATSFLRPPSLTPPHTMAVQDEAIPDPA